MFGPSKAELRARVEALEARSLENPQVPISAQSIVSFFGMDGTSAAGEVVTIDSAMGVPAVWDAVNFLSGTLAGLPLHVYRKTKAGREKVSGAIADLLHDAANDEMSSFEWRMNHFTGVFTHGRGVSFIERAATGRPLNLWPLDPTRVSVRRVAGRRFYDYRDGNRTVTYAASEVIDTPFALKSDGLVHRSPILSNKDVIGQAQAVTKYAARFFANGGVPAFAVTGNFQSPNSMQRAGDDLAAAVKKAAAEQRQALVLPTGLEIKPIGVDAQKSQLVETQRFLVEQVARIFHEPPTFLQDLSNGTYSNTEQQDLHFTKHTIKRWAEQFEQECNLKLFGRSSNRQYVEFSLDGLLRGDAKSRFEGYAQAIQHGVLKPNEARQMENRPDDPDGDGLFMQGAMMPIGKLGQAPPAPAPAAPEPAGDDDA